MPGYQPPNDSPQGGMRIAPHLDLEHTKLRPTEPDQSTESAGPRPEVRDARAETAAGAAPRDFQARRSQPGNRALWFLALAAAALVASIFLREVKDQAQAAVSDSGGVSAGSVMDPTPAAEPAPAD